MLISLLPGQVRPENPIGSIQTSIVTPDSDILPVADEETAERNREREKERDLCVSVITSLVLYRSQKS